MGESDFLDVIIVGAGLAGLTLAAVLGRVGLKVALFDCAPPVKQIAPGYDARTTALSFATSRVLKVAGVWSAIEKISAPIDDIRVIDGTAPVFLHFSKEIEGEGEPFGWNLENIHLRKILFDNLQGIPGVTLFAPVEIEYFLREKETVGLCLKESRRRFLAPLMIGADGRHSTVRQWLNIKAELADYGQTAIVCNIHHQYPHENVAIEHFLPQGPFAILPLATQRQKGQEMYCSSVVWTVAKQEAKGLCALPTEEFEVALQKMCGDHLGSVKLTSLPKGYPLQLMHAHRYIAPRVALVAEAAHAVHPIAGQGLNLSMRDVALLAELIIDRARIGLDIGLEDILLKYENFRRADIHLMAGFTHGLNILFSNHLKSISALRNLGLGIVQQVPPLKRFFARQAMGLGSRQGRILHAKSL